MIFAGVYIIFSAMRYLNYVGNFKTGVFNDEIGQGGAAIYYAGMSGWFDALYWLTIIAIAVCVFEFLLNFTIVCYHYDNCSWKSVQFIRDLKTTIYNRWKQSYDYNVSENRKARFALKAEIDKIKNNNREL